MSDKLVPDHLSLENIEKVFYHGLTTYNQTDNERLLMSDEFIRQRSTIVSTASYELKDLRETLSRNACMLNPNNKEIQMIWLGDLRAFDKEEQERRIDLTSQLLDDMHRTKRDRELNASLHKSFIGKSIVNELLATYPQTKKIEAVQFIATIDGPAKLVRPKKKKPVQEELVEGDGAQTMKSAPQPVVAREDLFSIVDKIVDDYESRHIQQKNADGEKIVQDIIANGEIDPVLRSTLLLATSYATCASAICIDHTKRFIIEHTKSKEDKNMLTDMVSSMLPNTPPKSAFAKGAQNIFDKLSKN